MSLGIFCILFFCIDEILTKFVFILDFFYKLQVYNRKYGLPTTKSKQTGVQNGLCEQLGAAN